MKWHSIIFKSEVNHSIVNKIMNRYAGLLAILIISISIMSIGFVVASDSDSDSDSDSEDKQPDQQTTPATTPTPASTDRVGQILQESNISRNPPGVDSGGVGSIS